MIRTKWLTLTLGLTIAQIAETFRANNFSRGQISGFELFDVKNLSLGGKYIEESIANEVVVDPFGDEIVNVVKRYLIYDFQISQLRKNQFLIRISNPPRSLKNFISKLADMFEFGFTISALEIDILKMIEHIRADVGKNKWKIKKVKMSDIRLNETSLAKIEVESTRDAYLDLKKCLSLGSAKLERATIELNDKGNFAQIEISFKGTISGAPHVLDEFTPTFQQYFS